MLYTVCPHIYEISTCRVNIFTKMLIHTCVHYIYVYTLYYVHQCGVIYVHVDLKYVCIVSTCAFFMTTCVLFMFTYVFIISTCILFMSTRI